MEVIGTAIDITERKLAEDRVKEMAFQDPLTNLPNRRLLEQHVNALLRKQKQEAFSILFLDIDRFKNINDTFGHAFGDKLLIAIADRIKSLIKQDDLIFRQGGDEFIILLPKQNQQQVTKTVNRLIGSMDNSFLIDDIEIVTSVSIGASLYPKDGETVEILMKHADAAMYFAKGKGENKFQFYRENVDMKLRDKFIIETDLRKAIQHKQLELFYQPQVEMKEGKIIGLEALIRWNHPELGYISPADFIPIAEETELIIPIGNWVLETACKQFKIWRDKGYSTVTLSVNVSQWQFIQPNFVQTVQRILSNCAMSSGNLELEMTESIMADFPRTERILKQLDEIGIKISMDDFGTGYSSLSYLNKLPIHKLKMDQSFLNPLNKSNKSIMKTIIGLARNLNMEVIAEGVENEQQIDFLKEQNCYQAQGYYFDKPLPAKEVEARLAEEAYSFNINL